MDGTKPLLSITKIERDLTAKTLYVIKQRDTPCWRSFVRKLKSIGGIYNPQQRRWEVPVTHEQLVSEWLYLYDLWKDPQQLELSLHLSSINKGMTAA